MTGGANMPPSDQSHGPQPKAISTEFALYPHHFAVLETRSQELNMTYSQIVREVTVPACRDPGVAPMGVGPHGGHTGMSPKQHRYYTGIVGCCGCDAGWPQKSVFSLGRGTRDPSPSKVDRTPASSQPGRPVWRYVHETRHLHIGICPGGAVFCRIFASAAGIRRTAKYARQPSVRGSLRPVSN